VRLQPRHASLNRRRPAQQLRQLGDVGGGAPNPVAGEELGRRSPSRLILEVDVASACPLASRTMKQASGSSAVQGGGKLKRIALCDRRRANAAVMQTVRAAEKVARYRHAQLSAIKLAGDINAKVTDNASLDELIAKLKGELHKLNY
jgi:hypothetical protein